MPRDLSRETAGALRPESRQRRERRRARLAFLVAWARRMDRAALQSQRYPVQRKANAARPGLPITNAVPVATKRPFLNLRIRRPAHQSGAQTQNEAARREPMSKRSNEQNRVNEVASFCSFSSLLRVWIRYLRLLSSGAVGVNTAIGFTPSAIRVRYGS